MTSPYHSHYSEETLTLIEKCITDLKLTTLQKKTILADLKRGKPIPDLVAPSPTIPQAGVRKKPQSRARRAQKRKIETIIQCGAYEIPVYVPDSKISEYRSYTNVHYEETERGDRRKKRRARMFDREEEKQRLQDIFYGLDQIPEETKHADADDTTRKKPFLEGSRHAFEYERMNELAEEIDDRIQFLRTMEEYGLKKKYEFEISNEIAEKVNQLENLRKRVQ